jgi:hypothetical protein
MASLILGTVGTIIAGPFGGFIGSAIGGIIDAYLFTPSPPDVTGPKLEDTQATAADPGVPIPWLFGTDRIGAVIVQNSDLIETAHDKEVKSGKKSYTSTTYTYAITLAAMICEGPILGFGRIWADGNVIRGPRGDFTADTQAYRYNVAAYPYPAWYRLADRMYDPALCPWSLDPALNNASATRWTLDGSGNLVVADAAAQTAALANYDIIYWQDLDTNYYHPLASQVAYDPTGSVVGPDGTIYTGGNTPPDPNTGGSGGGGLYRTWNDYYNLHAALNDFSPLAVLGFQNPDNLTFYRGTDDQPADATLTAQRGTAIPGYVNRAYIMMENFQLEDFGNRLPSLTFEACRFENETITSTIDSVMARAGVPQTYYDTADLPTTGLDAFLPGYTVNRRTSARKALEPALSAFRVDVAEIGTELKFRPRNRVAEHVVDYLDLRARPANSTGGDEPLIKIITKDQRELPRTVEIVFKDIEKDYQQNSARYQRTQTLNDHLGSTSTAVIVYPYFAKVWAVEALRDAWLQKNVEFSLPYEYLKVSPSDIITIITDIVIGTENGLNVIASLTIKIGEMRLGRNGVLDCKGTLTGSAFYDPDEAYYNNIVNENNYVSTADNDSVGLTRFVLLDLAPLSEAEILYGFYVAGSDFNSNAWGGADVLQSTDGGVNYNAIATIGAAAAIGTVTTGTLSTIDFSRMEYTTDIIVTLDSAQAQIFSITPDQLFNEFGNMALIGNEIVCFTDATYLGGRQFRLYGAWARGLKDTENTAHGANESFVLLDGAVVNSAANLANINIALLYKPVTIGNTDALTPSTPGTHTGKRLVPFSPAMVAGTRDGSNNLTITWVREDRLYYSWIDNSDIPLSESSLSFEVDILDAPAGSVLRTIVVTAETASYTSAEQTTDGLTPGDLINMNVYQISSAVGRGKPAQELI